MLYFAGLGFFILLIIYDFLPPSNININAILIVAWLCFGLGKIEDAIKEQHKK